MQPLGSISLYVHVSRVNHLELDYIVGVHPQNENKNWSFPFSIVLSLLLGLCGMYTIQSSLTNESLYGSRNSSAQVHSIFLLLLLHFLPDIRCKGLIVHVYICIVHNMDTYGHIFFTFWQVADLCKSLLQFHKEASFIGYEDYT